MTDFAPPVPRPVPPPVPPAAPPRDARAPGETAPEAFPVEWVLVPEAAHEPAGALVPDFFAH